MDSTPKKSRVYYYSFYKITNKGMEIAVTYGLREGLKFVVNGFKLCGWGITKEMALAVAKQIAKEKGFRAV